MKQTDKSFILPAIIAAAVFLAWPVQAQFTILPSKESRAPATANQVPYQLQNDILHFQVEVRKEHLRPGRFADHAASLLGIDPEITRDEIRYMLGSVSVSLSTSPDGAHTYMLPLSFENRKSPEDAAVFNEDGVLVYFGKSSRMPARAAGHAHGHPTETGWTPLDQPPAAVPMDAGTEVKDTLSRIVREEDTTYRRRVVHTVVRPHSEAELAEEAAAQVIRLRESRIRLLTGYQEVPYSAEAIRYMDEGIRSAYDEYLALFTGSVQRFTRNYSFSHQPVASRDSSWVPLFRFSPESGIHGLDAREGELVYLRYLPERMLPDSSLIQASMSATEGAAPEKVLMYRIPAATLIELRYQDEILFSTREQISQLGRVRSLPVSKVSVELDPVSGRPVRVFLDN